MPRQMPVLVRVHFLNKQPQFVRWYDKYDNVCALINLTRELPLTVQENIGMHLLDLIDYYQDALGWEKDLKSLGTEAILSLYKSKRKLRWYDKIPSLHRAFSQMAILPDEVLLECDSRFGPLINYLEKHKRSFISADMAETIYSYINPNPLVGYEFKEDWF